MNKKPRGDSKLKTLPEDRQAAIIEYLSGHTLADGVKWLREDGVDTSSAALSGFREWWYLREQFRQDESTAESLVEQLKAEAPQLSEAELDDLGQRTFSLLSIRRQDLGGFIKVRSARSKAVLEAEKLKLREAAERRLREGLMLQREKFQRETCANYLSRLEDSESRRIAALNMPNEEKIRLLRQHWFADVDALEKSGEVKLPE